ncbi:Permease protein of ABC transporter system for sugars galactan metabolism [Bifidobacterium breve]|nr:Permease protein of ABC transporter system for sugars galactan metabolism [Bifidobacterium breve]
MAAASQPTVGILPEEADLHTAEARVNKHKADWRGWKFMWPFTVVFVFVFIIPIVYAVYISFFKKQMIGGTRFVGVENYARLLQDGQFWSSVGRVALFTCVQVPIMLFLSAAMALALDSMKLHGAKFFRISTFLPYAVPAVVSTLVWGFVYGAKYGLVGSFNDFFGTNVDVLQPSVLLASIGNISTWEITGSLITIIPLVIAFLCLQKYWQSGLAAGAVKEQLLLPLTLLREGSWRNGVLASLSEESCRTQ